MGNLHRVPDFLSLYPQAQQVAPFAGMDRPLCDRKRVVLNDQMQTQRQLLRLHRGARWPPTTPASSSTTPSREFNAIAPDFGEKASVPFVPVSIKDFAGLEISRTYSDQWGAYNMMTPSSWLVNPPTPSGYGPNMLVTCMNDPGPIPDPSGAIDPATGKARMIIDPAVQSRVQQLLLHEPVHAGADDVPGHPGPAHRRLRRRLQPGRLRAAGRLAGRSSGWTAAPASARGCRARGGTLTITAEGDQQVLNPAYAGPFATSGLASQRTLTRHYGFGGTPGHGEDRQRRPHRIITSWSDAVDHRHRPARTRPRASWCVTTAAGRSTVDTVTVNIANADPDAGDRERPEHPGRPSTRQAPVT